VTAALPVWVHELVVAPIVLALAFDHARRALGPGRALVETGALVAYGFALERLAIVVFASHDYGSAWRLAPSGVPLAVAVVWAAVILSALALAARLGRPPGIARAAAAALLGISLDLLMEPVAVRSGLWRWTPPGGWLDVPIGNFIGWAVIVGVYALGAERQAATTDLRRVGLGRVLLALGSMAALVAVGLAWRRFGAEAVFDGWAGWLAWAAALLATVAAAAAPRPRAAAARDATLAARLAASPGRGPELVFALLALVFSVDALGTHDTLLAAPAGATLAVLLWVGARARPARLLQKLLEARERRVSRRKRLELLARLLVAGIQAHRGAQLGNGA
jgi:hypothetical protein